MTTIDRKQLTRVTGGLWKAYGKGGLVLLAGVGATVLADYLAGTGGFEKDDKTPGR